MILSSYSSIKANEKYHYDFFMNGLQDKTCEDINMLPVNETDCLKPETINEVKSILFFAWLMLLFYQVV